MKYDCPKCNGTGDLPHHRNVLGGVCFQCKGTGRAARKPAKPSTRWAFVYGGKVLFWRSARTEAEALRKAIAHLEQHRDAPAFQGLTAADVSVRTR